MAAGRDLRRGPPAAAAPAQAQKAVFLVRHAEKVDESEDALLSAAGEARGRALARSLRYRRRSKPST